MTRNQSGTQTIIKSTYTSKKYVFERLTGKNKKIFAITFCTTHKKRIDLRAKRHFSTSNSCHGQMIITHNNALCHL